MAAMFNPPSYPQPRQAPPAPSLDQAAIRQADDDRQRVKQGSASNYLTNPAKNNLNETSQARQALGV